MKISPKRGEKVELFYSDFGFLSPGDLYRLTRFLFDYKQEFARLSNQGGIQFPTQLTLNRTISNVYAQYPQGLVSPQSKSDMIVDDLQGLIERLRFTVEDRQFNDLLNRLTIDDPAVSNTFFYFWKLSQIAGQLQSRILDGLTIFQMIIKREYTQDIVIIENEDIYYDRPVISYQYVPDKQLLDIKKENTQKSNLFEEKKDEILQEITRQLTDIYNDLLERRPSLLQSCTEHDLRVSYGKRFLPKVFEDIEKTGLVEPLNIKEGRLYYKPWEVALLLLLTSETKNEYPKGIISSIKLLAKNIWVNKFQR